MRHRFCRKEWDITPSLTGKITGRGPSGTQRGRHNFSECVFQLPLLKFSLQASSSLGPFKTGGCWKRVSNEPHCPWSPGWTNVLSCLAHAVPLPPHLILPMRNLTLLEIKCLLLVTWLPSDRTRIYVFWLAAECFFCSTLLPR